LLPPSRIRHHPITTKTAANHHVSAKNQKLTPTFLQKSSSEPPLSAMVRRTKRRR
jgi:hypothetical protein